METPFDRNVADFYCTESANPFDPGADFEQWLGVAKPLRDLYRVHLTAGAGPVTTLRSKDGTSRRGLNLTSCNYLGLAQHPEVALAARNALDTFGAAVAAAPLIGGTTEPYAELAAAVSTWLGREDTTIHSSGFSGGASALSACLRRGDVAVLDELAHASLREGARLAGARLESFRHNDAESLARALERYPAQRRVVLLDGIYSMDGDEANLAELVPVARAHGAGLLVDEAHSILTCGPQGRGLVHREGFAQHVDLLEGTFSKAFGCAGGFISASSRVCEYLRLFAQSYGFSAALSPVTCAAVSAALRVATRNNELQHRLADNADYFRAGLRTLEVDFGASTTHVVPLLMGSDRPRFYAAAERLLARGVWMTPVDYPAVPEDGLRFRAALSAAHTREQLDAALNIIEDVISTPLRAARRAPQRLTEICTLS
jgi:glycine C-acetyltransferase